MREALGHMPYVSAKVAKFHLETITVIAKRMSRDANPSGGNSGRLRLQNAKTYINVSLFDLLGSEGIRIVVRTRYPEGDG